MVCGKCGKPAFSSSIEHEPRELCFDHYQDFLENRERYRLEQMEREVATMKAKLGGKK